MKINLRTLYLYLFSFVGLLIVVFGSIRIVDLGLKTVVFKDADKYVVYPPKIEGSDISPEDQQKMQDRETLRQRQRDLSSSLAMIVVGIPLYVYHWKTIQREAMNSVKA